MATITGAQVQGAARAAGGWVETAGRIGAVAKGITYVLVGLTALRVAAAGGGKTAGRKEILVEIGDAPLGAFLLGAIGLGLLGYALWRALQTFLPAEQADSRRKAVMRRIGHGVSAVVHAGLGISAFRILAGEATRSGEASAKGWTARLMSEPLGVWLVALVGVAVLVAAGQQLVRARRATFLRQLNTGGMGPQERLWITRLGRLGHAARAVVFTLIGLFLLNAAAQAEPQQARGLGGALAALVRQPYGPWLLGVVALGLVSYGMYALAEARHRRMNIVGA